MSETIIQLRRDTQSKWSQINPILLTGEIGIETDAQNLKIGKGGLSWNDLGKLPTFKNAQNQISDFLVL